MEFQTSRAHFALDAAAASVLSAWESSQRHPPMHRQQMPYNGFPITPISPSSSSSSSASSMSALSNNYWAPSSMSELDMLQLRRAMMPGSGPIAVRGPGLPAAANHDAHFFDFDFNLPHLPHLSLQPQPQQQPQLRCSPPLPTPTTPSSSSTLFSSPPVSPSSNMNYRRESPPMKRAPSDDTSDCSTSPVTSGTKKPRACMSLKDFVPPDVTGLSKREARLVKNRAAAFLSRQRKREEFEVMEIRVAELERENERLRELADGVEPSHVPSSESSEVELLRMQLAAARQRESELVHRIECLKHEQQKIKTEISEPVLSDEAGSETESNSPLLTPGSPLRNIVGNSKGGASLGLMVLLCALPSLLSNPSSNQRSTLPSSRSFLDTIQWEAPSFFPTSASTSATLDEVPSWDLDFTDAERSSSGNMDMDVDYGNVHNTEEAPEWKKLELGLEGGDSLGLGALDISFSTTRTKDGKIRVRVNSSPSVSASKTERTSPTPNGLADPTLMAFSLPSPADSQLQFASASSSKSDTSVNPLSFSFADSDPLGPFLGAGTSPTGTFELGTPFDFANPMSRPSDRIPNLISGLSGPDSVLDGAKSGERRRVRIALRSLPQPGGEGGEWEVEVR